MEKQTAGHDSLGDFSPKFAQLNDEVLFGEIWSREKKLSLKNRSMITIASLIGKGILDDSLKYHILNGKKNGITKEEIAEILMHLAFYSGWPNAWAAFHMAKEVYQDETIGEVEHGGIFGLGEPNIDYAAYFIGNSYLKPLTNKEETSISIANVTFEPGCRNNWHIHKATKNGGQILICIEGEGWYQEEGKEAQSLKEGDIVSIPANVKHWHGAKNNSWFSHLAIEVPGEGTENQWLEEVSEEQYHNL